MTKGVKLKFRKFLGLIPTFVEVTGEKLVRGSFCPPAPILNRVKSCFSFKFKQHGQQQLYRQYKVSRILSKMVGALSFSQPYLCIQLSPKSPRKAHFSYFQLLQLISPTSAIFTSLFPSYLFIKSSLQSPLTLPSSIPQQFFTSLFLCTALQSKSKLFSLPRPYI